MFFSLYLIFHSRVGMWSIVLSVVFLSLYLSIPYLLFFSSFREMSDDGLDIGTIMLLVQIVPLVIGGLSLDRKSVV